MKVRKFLVCLLMAMLITSSPVINAYGSYDGIGNVTISQDVQKYLNMESPIISATSSDSNQASIQYQWYVNNSKSLDGGVAIENGILPNYPAPTGEIGKKYYYCLLTSITYGTSCYSNIITVEILDNKNIEPSYPVFNDGFQLENYSTKVNSNVTIGFPLNNEGIFGKISYQWYSNTVSSTNGATMLVGNNDFLFSPSTNKAGIIYYFCVATNRLFEQEKSTTSCILKFEVTEDTTKSPQMPTMYLPYDGIDCYKGDTNSNLHANVNISDSGDLTLQWYKNSVNSTNGAVPIDGAISKDYIPDCSTVGTTYYFFVARNTLNSQSVYMTSNIMHCIVKELPNEEAKAPEINIQPGSYSSYVNPNGCMVGFGVNSANSPGILTKQWYSNTLPKIQGAIKLEGETSTVFNMPTNKVGLMYYFCVATNTVGTSSASVTSNIVFAKVIAPNTSIDEYGSYVIKNTKLNCTVAGDFIYKGTELNFKELDNSTVEYDIFRSNKSDELNIIKVYDISLAINQQKVDVQGKYLVTFKVDSIYEGKELVIYHNTGSFIEELKGIVKDGKITVQTSGFSPFAIAASKTIDSNTLSNSFGNSEGSTKTGDQSQVIFYCGFMAMTCILLLLLKRQIQR